MTARKKVATANNPTANKRVASAKKKVATAKKKVATANKPTANKRVPSAKKKMMTAKQPRRLRRGPVAAVAVESAHPHPPWIAEAHPVANPRGVKEILADIERDFAPIMARLAQ